VKNEKGDYEIVINTTACDAQGEPHKAFGSQQQDLKDWM
jgi:hypothetical protein